MLDCRFVIAFAAFVMTWGACGAAAGAPPSLEEILRPSRHTLVQISPGGRYIGATLREPENNQNLSLIHI